MKTFSRFALFLMIAILLIGVLPAPAVEAAPPVVPNSLAHKTERVFWSDTVAAEDADGSDWLTFTSGDLHMEMEAVRVKCTLSPIYVYWQGKLVADLRCSKFVWRRGGQWIPEIHWLYEALPPNQQ